MRTAYLLSAALLAALSGIAQAAEKPEIVLVHGAFEDASVWQGVEATLRQDGFRTKTIDLPGRPGNPLSPEKATLDGYVAAVRAGIAGETSPVVLVGHSFGGIVISQTAEADPARIRSLVYVAAYLPRDGQSLLTLATADKDSKAGAHLQIDKDKGIASIDYAARAELFANDGPAALKSAIPSLILDEPLAPLAQPVHLSAAFAHVKKSYVFTAQDQVISPWLQQAMTTTTPVARRFTLNTGHTPFLTDVPGLVRAIEASAD